MHIILDSNIYLADIKMAGISFQNLFTLIRRTQSTLVLPHLVREEVVARYQERLRKAISGVQKAWKPYRDLMLCEQPGVFDEPEIMRQRHELRRRLRNPARGIAIRNLAGAEGVDIKDVYLRGINRKPPASETGEELRDVILWLLTMAYAKKVGCAVAFVSGDTGFREGDAVASEILEDIRRQQVEIKVFSSIGALITNASPTPAPIAAERVGALIDQELLNQAIVSAARDALNLRFNNHRGASYYAHGDMRLTAIHFSSGSLYTVDSDVDFAEINYVIELLRSHTQNYPIWNQQDALASLSATFSPPAPLGFFGAPAGVFGFPVQPQEPPRTSFTQREHISAEALVFARIVKGKLQTFEVHEVAFRSVKRE
jgi:hypothetical protein